MMRQAGIVTNVLFPCPSPSYTIHSFPGELIWVPMHGTGGDGTTDQSMNSVPCLLLLYESARFIIIYFHGNAEDLGRSHWFCCFLRDQFQVHVLAVEYPGYGVCLGRCDRESVMVNAHAGLRFVTHSLKLPLDRVKLFGRSIGTGPALMLAARYKVAGLVLVSPFINIKDLFQEKVGPLAAFVEEWFSNDKEMVQVQSATLIIHGQRDILIPCSHGRSLFDLCPSRKVFINPEFMEHNTNLTVDHGFLILPMFRFFALPDYSFQELHVPTWAFDKRRSPLYKKPDVQVCSRQKMGQSALDGASGIMMPAGDLADPCPSLPRHSSKNRSRFASGRRQSAPMPDALTQPTVLHSGPATKRGYSFHDLNREEPDSECSICLPARRLGKVNLGCASWASDDVGKADTLGDPVERRSAS